MKVCVVGAGGVGGLLAAVLRRAEVDVSLLVTERHLEPIRRKGLTLIGPKEQFSVQIQAEVDPRAIGACDVVVVTPKNWAVEALAPTLKPLLAEDTAVIPLQNGIDAWRILEDKLGPGRVIPGVCETLSELGAPGRVVQHSRATTLAAVAITTQEKTTPISAFAKYTQNAA